MSEYRNQELIEWNGQTIGLGETRDVRLTIGESYSGISIRIPVQIRRGPEPGPTVFVTAALHGNEINGTGAIRQLIQDEEFQLTRGSVILIPVVNLIAFERHSRYLPDRRDLNRCFPGSQQGSLAARMAYTLFHDVAMRCDFGIDLHTASIRRTNYPNVRGDLKNKAVAELANSFGSEIVVHGKGPEGSLRREASAAGCPTIIMEGGEVCKVEPWIVESGARGVRNVLRDLNVLDSPRESPKYNVTIEKTSWVRAGRGGFLQFHVQPGEFVQAEQPLATVTSLLGVERSMLQAPFDGVIIGMTTLPAIAPGEPVCHLGKLPEGTKTSRIDRHRALEEALEGRLVDSLASNILVTEPTEENDSNDSHESDKSDKSDPSDRSDPSDPSDTSDLATDNRG